MTEERDGIAAMARLLAEAVDVFSRNPTTPGCMITMAPAGRSDDPLVQFARQLRADALAQVEERLRRAQSEGQIRADADCAAWARYVTTIVQGLSVQARDGATPEAMMSLVRVTTNSLEELRPS